MNLPHQALARIILKSISGKLSPEERQQLDAFLRASVANLEKYREMTDTALMEKKLAQYEEIGRNREAHYAGILRQLNMQPQRSLRKMYVRIASAAAVLLLLIAAVLWFRPRPQSEPAPAGHLADVAPGRTGAILTLSDGTQVVLDSIGNGTVARQQGASVRMQSGNLVYDADGAATGKTAYNIMATPKGRQFNLTLPDGTKVWLNAASSLKYPTAFNSKERIVSVSGEAYFEVAQDASKPFKVQIDDETAIEVLGTSFNVNAYTNEQYIRTTLMDGSIRTGGITLQPGSQARTTRGGATIVERADMNKATAWKNGIFNFNDASLQEVMRQLERWYDIDVVYEKDVPDTYFYGKVSRDVSLAGILKVLKATRVHFRIEGRKLIVMQ